MADYDVAIVGGGPTGLVAAIEARLAGLNVVVIEQRDGTIDKACGEGLMPGALPALERLGVDPVGMPIAGISYVQGRLRITHRFSGSPGRGVRRVVLHEALARRAAALGVERIVARVDAVAQDAHGVVVAGLTARYLLACDGLHSTVAALVGLSRPAPRRRRRFGIRQHYELAPWGDTVEIHYARRAEIYVTPISENEIGVAVLGQRRTDFDRVIAEIPELATRLDGVTPASSRRGAGPFRQRTRARTSGRVLLVGDASGYVDAITGEGLRLGFAEAQAAIMAVLSDDPARYEHDWLRITRDFRLTTSTLVWFATSPLRRAIVPLSVALPGRFGAVVESLAR
ncbi:MAG TPA: NAD(P)/FAD-dependent oxidoreductase [Galbitalea sp.]|nr:NAD(P)/FAD-dependent oxidoreductase [Galbitalea sp.]